ncbi:MAG: Dihydroanticapsin 7-dehydrogenase [Gammaproteobacteria bacterium]|nr:Dihydroanticapsin 7-dehydrogenase [Gammaproteobacteria bacterium]
MRLKDQVALVTGGAQGIGLACVERFVEDGSKVAILDLDSERGNQVVSRLGHGTMFIHGDVGDKSAVDDAVKQVVSHFGALNIAVSNAAIVHSADFLDIEEQDFDRVLRVNLKGMFLVGQASARRMVKQESGGAIINMSSVNAVVAIPNQVPYVVAKGGVAQLTKLMSLSLAAHNIRVNAIGPGSILTELLESVVSSDDAARNKILSRTPMGRIGTPSEVASIASFLASNDASYVTGQTIYADGGRLGLNYTVPVS